MAYASFCGTLHEKTEDGQIVVSSTGTRTYMPFTDADKPSLDHRGTFGTGA